MKGSTLHLRILLVIARLSPAIRSKLPLKAMLNRRSFQAVMVVGGAKCATFL